MSASRRATVPFYMMLSDEDDATLCAIAEQRGVPKVEVIRNWIRSVPIETSIDKRLASMEEQLRELLRRSGASR